MVGWLGNFQKGFTSFLTDDCAVTANAETHLFESGHFFGGKAGKVFTGNFYVYIGCALALLGGHVLEFAVYHLADSSYLLLEGHFVTRFRVSQLLNLPTLVRHYVLSISDCRDKVKHFSGQFATNLDIDIPKNGIILMIRLDVVT